MTAERTPDALGSSPYHVSGVPSFIEVIGRMLRRGKSPGRSTGAMAF